MVKNLKFICLSILQTYFKFQQDQRNNVRAKKVVTTWLRTNCNVVRVIYAAVLGVRRREAACSAATEFIVTGSESLEPAPRGLH